MVYLSTTISMKQFFELTKLFLHFFLFRRILLYQLILILYYFISIFLHR